MKDGDAFIRECAQQSRNSLIATCILAVVIIGGLVWKAIEWYTAQAASWKAAQASIPMGITESDFAVMLVIGALCVLGFVAGVVIMSESNKRYWGTK